MSSLKQSAIANRIASEKNGGYVYDSLKNCIVEKVASWSYDDIEVVGIKFTDSEGDAMQLNCRLEDVNFDQLKALEGAKCDIRAKIWHNSEGIPEFNGQTTIWSFSSASVVPVVADGIIRGAVSPK